MAITKIHPIKSTLNLAIDYIINEAKTDEKILVTTNNCFPATAHTQFLKTREDNNVKGTVLTRHLIQPFLPNETTPEQAHQIGLDLCNKILKDEYEFVLTTHIDKGHIHNHITFNNVNMVTGKCYQSNKKSYHKIRYQSDKLCKENNLVVIDEHYETYNIKLVASHGMKMNSLRKDFLGKASYNLILIKPLNNQKTGMIFLIRWLFLDMKLNMENILLLSIRIKKGLLDQKL